MPLWKEYKNIAKERGSLAHEWYVVETTAVAEPEQVKATLPEHLAYQQQLEREGKLAFAGPVSDLSGELMEGNGLAIYRVASLEEARALADNDPMHKRGVRSYTLRRWLINEGSVSVTVGLSSGSVQLG